MNIRDLKYLVAVADFGHFGKAASHCCVSQPALSMQIKKLEELFGVQLIERSTKSVLLTAVGAAIVERTRGLLCQVEEIKGIAQEARDPFSGQLTLGIIPTFAPYVLPHIISGLSKAFPRLILYLVEEKTHILLDRLRQGAIDIALLAIPITEQGFMISPLFKEEFMLAVNRSHSLAKQKVIKAADLQTRSLLLLEEGHCMRDQALEFCQKMMLSEENSFKATSLETLRYMVAANVGITLMPRLACKADDGISYIPFNTPKPTRTAGLVWRLSTPKVDLFKALACEIKKLMGKQKIIKI